MKTSLREDYQVGLAEERQEIGIPSVLCIAVLKSECKSYFQIIDQEILAQNYQPYFADYRQRVRHSILVLLNVWISAFYVSSSFSSFFPYFFEFLSVVLFLLKCLKYKMKINLLTHLIE